MKKKKLWIGLMLCIALMGGCGVKQENVKQETQKAEKTQEIDTTQSEEIPIGNCTVAIEIEDYGTIKVALDADAAPITVSNFVKLVKEGFYDGVTFHRIMNNFMMQGGDPTGTGMGGSGQTIKGEFESNGVKNDLHHTRGAISMARAKGPDSASSQFFIVHQDSLFLDGQYACFGYVTEGLDVVDVICENAVVVDANGTVDQNSRPVIKKITVEE